VRQGDPEWLGRDAPAGRPDRLGRAHRHRRVVDADGTIHTIEDNSSDRLSQRTYGRDGGGALGYVRLG
jgi:hypothetical protein